MTSTGNNWVTPPTPDEFEVSIFGPGFGECVIIHFGNAQWGVVDSCLDPDSKRPAALEYFQAIHVDVEQSVRCIIATHWHDDHIHGISSVFEAAKHATISCTAAVATDQFIPILASWHAMQSLPGGSGVNELRRILVELKSRKPHSEFPSPVLASANKTLWQRSESPTAIVKSLSPSDAAIIATTARLTSFAPMASEIRRRIPDIKPNDASVVLSVTVGPHKVLLGADLEIRNDPALGWKAILESELTAEGGQQGYKIPHHGSPNGHSADVWAQMLTPNPWAATTPFVSGNVKLPDIEDCRRILNHTPRAYLTAPPRPSKFRDPNRTVEKTVNEVARSVHVLPGKYGHVRMRKKFASKVDAPWNFELFGSAVTMQDFVNASQ